MGRRSHLIARRRAAGVCRRALTIVGVTAVGVGTGLAAAGASAATPAPADLALTLTPVDVAEVLRLITAEESPPAGSAPVAPPTSPSTADHALPDPALVSELVADGSAANPAARAAAAAPVAPEIGADDGMAPTPSPLLAVVARFIGRDLDRDGAGPRLDLSQVYSTHPANQVFLREYALNRRDRPVATGELLQGPGRGLATWGMAKRQAAEMLGLLLADADAADAPLIATDSDGRFIPGARGLPQYVTESGLVEGDLADPVAPPADARRTGVAFLDALPPSATPLPEGIDEGLLLDGRLVAGDGRVGDDLAVTSVHELFHLEHDRLVGEIKRVLLDDASGTTRLADWQRRLGAADGDGVWDGERLFLAARLLAEMEYRRIVIEDFGTRVLPTREASSSTALAGADLAGIVDQLGWSMIPAVDPPAPPTDAVDSPPQTTGSILLGLSEAVADPADEFVADGVRVDSLGGEPDPVAGAVAGARAAGTPTLNALRRAIHDQTADPELAPYTSWAEVGAALRHPESLINLIAAYGRHPSVQAQSSAAGRRAAASVLAGAAREDARPADASEFVHGIGAWAGVPTGIDDIDLWIGGLAERPGVRGGLLGPTLGQVFAERIAELRAIDPAPAPGDGLAARLEAASLSRLIARNTEANPGPDAFSAAGPDLSITSPPMGETLDGVVAFTASAADPSGVAQVQFTIDGRPLWTEVREPYGDSGPLDTRALSEGVHTLAVTATDGEGNTTTTSQTVTVDNTPGPRPSVPRPSLTPPPPAPTAPGPAPAPPAPGEALSGSVVFRGDVESGDLSLFRGVQTVADDRIQIVSSPVAQGAKAARFEVRQGDRWQGSTGNRAEVTVATNEREGDELWYQWNTMFAPGYPSNGSSWQIFTQWHATVGGTQPMIAFFATGDSIGFKTVESGSDLSPDRTVTRWTGPMDRGRWHTFRLHVKWSANAADGYVELWHDGTKVVQRAPVGAIIPGYGVYLKQGLYRNADIGPTAVLYHDGLTVTRVN